MAEADKKNYFDPKVLASIAKGMSNQEIADSLLISRTTVRTHVRHILGKLGASNRTQAALFAVEAGILSPNLSG